jgi:2-methylcitrate dehydratase PrpD
MRNAIGIAITHSGGVTAVFGSMSKAYQCGKAAQAGVRAALLAEMGFDSAAEPLTHPQGYLNVASTDHNVGRLTDHFVKADGTIIHGEYFTHCFILIYLTFYAVGSKMPVKAFLWFIF